MESSFCPHLLDETSNNYKIVVSDKLQRIVFKNENDFMMYSHFPYDLSNMLNNLGKLEGCLTLSIF